MHKDNELYVGLKKLVIVFFCEVIFILNYYAPKYDQFLMKNVYWEKKQLK